MEKPQTVPGQEPESEPPPYSSLVSSQSQLYNPYLPSPTAPLCPMQMPMPQDTTSYNSTSQATMDDGTLISQPGFISAYVPTTDRYDFMENQPPVNQGSTFDQSMAVSLQSANFSGRTTRTFPVMDKPQLEPGQKPDLYPPPYSSLFGSESQSSLYPMQMPMLQDTTRSNPMSQATMDDGNPISQPDLNPTNSPTTCEPMENQPPVNQVSMLDQTITTASQTAASTSRGDRKRRYKIIGAAIGIFIIALHLGFRLW